MPPLGTRNDALGRTFSFRSVVGVSVRIVQNPRYWRAGDYIDGLGRCSGASYVGYGNESFVYFVVYY